MENKKPSLGDILPKSKDKLGQEGNLKIDPANVAILQRAEAAGFTFADSNSRTNSINIYDKSGAKIGNIITMV